MGVYLRYLRKLLCHKWHVLIECWRAGIPLRGFWHDMSKFSPDEFIPYARHFGRGKEADEKRDTMKHAWQLHKDSNPHHWQWWVLSKGPYAGMALPMTPKYRLEMLCDLKAADKTYGESAQEYYMQNRNDMNLHPATRTWLENELGIK